MCGSTGLYASSVRVGEDEIVTAYSCATDSQSSCPERGGKLSTLRWKPPAYEEVARGGFFYPVPPDGAREPSALWSAYK